MTRIAVLDDWQRVARACADWAPLEVRAEVRFFTEPFASEDDAAAALEAFNVILATRERTSFPRTLIDRLPALEMFGLTGVRAGKIDLAYLQQRGVTVCCTDGGPGVESTAELALALMLAAARRVPEGESSVRAGRFQLAAPTGFVLAGKTLGLVGLGRIGARMARYGEALGMTVLAWSQNLTDERAAEAGARRVGRDELLARADVVSLHLVLSPRTHHILGAAEIARMKRGAILVNTSRAPLVDEAALIAAARDGRVVAALDVYEREPLPAGHPLLACPNTVLTPHLGYSVLEVYRVFFAQCVENALAYLDGAPIRLLPIQGHDMNEESIAKAASLLIAARRTRELLDRLPMDCRPGTLEDALRIQAATVAQLGEHVAGWKVGSLIDGRLSYGVLLPSRIVESGGTFDARDGPLLGMEAEIGFRFLRDAPPRGEAYSYDEVAACVVAFAAIEIVATRYRDYQGTPLVERTADCMSNGAYVVGADRPDWRSFDLVNIPVRLAFGDEVIVQRNGGHTAGDPLKPAVGLVNDLRTSTGVRAGQLMTTGTYTGLNFATPGRRIRAAFERFGAVEVDVS